MGEMVTFKSNGHACDGYIAGSGPGVLVIQEWWGLVPHIKDVTMHIHVGAKHAFFNLLLVPQHALRSARGREMAMTSDRPD